jgi:transcriptional regulator GlxA family with amidase domain
MATSTPVLPAAPANQNIPENRLYTYLLTTTKKQKVDDLTAEFGLDRDRVLLFREKFGFTIHKVQCIVLLGRAKILVQTTDKPLREIANLVGYKNIYTFSEAYKNHFGQCPILDRPGKTHRLWKLQNRLTEGKL